MLTSENMRRVALCTDDRQPPDLLDSGGIDEMLRIVMAAGVPPVEAIRMATLNPAEYFGLRDRGAIAPGRRADMVVVEDLEDLSVSEVYSGGIQVARDGRPLPWKIPAPPAPPPPAMHIDWNTVDLELPPREGQARVIRVIPHQLLTETLLLNPTVRDGRVVSDVERDLLKITVIDRHTARPGAAVGLVNGMGFQRGAIAGTVAHDHHNLIAVGVEDEAILRAGRTVAEMGGGLSVATREEVLATLPLPVGGLMSPESIHDVRAGLDRVLGAARTLGSKLHDPFMAMSFLGLEVIPSLKITDQGLVDVDGFRSVSFWV
jgi:adenine deaminase